VRLALAAAAVVAARRDLSGRALSSRRFAGHPSSYSESSVRFEELAGVLSKEPTVVCGSVGRASKVMDGGEGACVGVGGGDSGSRGAWILVCGVPRG